MQTILEYKCPACGGSLNFDSQGQNMKCPYCDTEFSVESLQELDEALRREQPSDLRWETEPQSQWSEGETQNLRSYVCQSCGGEIVGDETTAATRCPYCDNPVVFAGQFSGDLRPDIVVPFRLDKEAAKQALANFVSKKPLLPALFKTQNRIESIQGLYVPFWLFDTDVDADFRFRGTRVRHWSDSNYNYTQTRHYSVHRSGSLGFSNVPVDGSSKMSNELMESIEPYDMTQAVDFQTAYLAGYLADKYDVDAQVCKPRANDRIQISTQQAFEATAAGYTTLFPENSSLRFRGGKVRYSLLPVWILTTRYQDKIYTFAMNGQTGKLVGNLPIHWGKFAAFWAGITLGVGTILSTLVLLLG